MRRKVEINGEQRALITYMVQIASHFQDALTMISATTITKILIPSIYPLKPEPTKLKLKNAQAQFRPIDTNLTPDSLRNILDEIFYRLYELIWRRTMA